MVKCEKAKGAILVNIVQCNAQSMVGDSTHTDDADMAKGLDAEDALRQAAHNYRAYADCEDPNKTMAESSRSTLIQCVSISRSRRSM